MVSLSTCRCWQVLSVLHPFRSGRSGKLCRNKVLEKQRGKMWQHRGGTQEWTTGHHWEDLCELQADEIYLPLWLDAQIRKMEIVDNLFEDWPESLDIFGSVLLDTLGVARAVDGWSVCLNLVENLCLDLLSQTDFLLEHRAVCFNILGPVYADDPYVWMFLHNWHGLKMHLIFN